VPESYKQAHELARKSNVPTFFAFAGFVAFADFLLAFAFFEVAVCVVASCVLIFSPLC
jgi:hypothetical protein